MKIADKLTNRDEKVILASISGFTLVLGSIQIADGRFMPGLMGFCSGLLFFYASDRIECREKCRHANNKLKSFLMFWD